MKKEASGKLVRDCMFTALLILMEQKNYEDITITEIAKKAGVSRMSYYRNYSSKEDILIQYFDELFDHFLEDMKSLPDLTRQIFTTHFFEAFRQNKRLIASLPPKVFYEIVMKYFIRCLSYLLETLYSQDPTVPCNDYFVHSEAGSLFTMAIHWLETGAAETPGEMAQIYERIKHPDFPDASASS